MSEMTFNWQPGYATQAGNVALLTPTQTLGFRGPQGPNAVGPATALNYAALTAASGNWNLAVANAAGTGFARLGLSPTVRGLLAVADGAALRAVLGTGTADNTTYYRGDGSWQPLSGIQTTNASLLTSGTLADARLTSNVPLKDAANVFTAGQAVAGTLTVRQPGGTVGTDEVQISHDGTRGLVQSRDGALQLLDANGTGLSVFKSGAQVQVMAVAATTLLLGNPESQNVRCGFWQSNYLTGAWEPSSSNYPLAWGADTAIVRSAARTLRVAGTGTNGSAAALSLAGPSSNGTLRDVGILSGGYATSTDATRQGQLSLGVYGIVGGTETLQTGLTVTARSSGLPLVQLPSNFTFEVSLASSASSQTGFAFRDVNGWTWMCGGVRTVDFAQNSLLLRSNVLLNWSTDPAINAADTGLSRSSAGVVEINNGTAGTYRDLRLRNVRTEPTTVASLPAAATAGAGARAFVTDATATTFASVVSGGGSNGVPVHSDGTSWRIG